MAGYSESFEWNDIPDGYSRVSLKTEQDVAPVNFPRGVNKKSRFGGTATVACMMALTFIASSTGIIGGTEVAMAQQMQIPTTAEEAVPKEVDDIMFYIQLICLGLCVGVAIIMAMIAGFFRMIGLREESKKRYTDAIAGMLMVLTAPAVLLVIATIVRGLLAILPGNIH